MPAPLRRQPRWSPWRAPWSPSLAGQLAGRLALALLLPATAGAAALAGPQADLAGYPAPGPQERRWLIQLPERLPAPADPALSPSPADSRVELIVGRTVEVDCNRVMFSGRLRSEPLAGGKRLIRVTEVTPLASTRMACPPEQPRRRAFVAMGGKPFVVPYAGGSPIVLIAPKDLELRWRLWRAERRQWPAQQR